MKLIQFPSINCLIYFEDSLEMFQYYVDKMNRNFFVYVPPGIYLKTEKNKNWN